MADAEMFDSAVRPGGDLAGAFEYDGQTGYFYLYKSQGLEGQKVIAAIRVLTGAADFEEDDLLIRWDATLTKVGLFIREHLWAVFDGDTGEKFGGNYRKGAKADIPPAISEAFTHWTDTPGVTSQN